jgi:hypothetical protein
MYWIDNDNGGTHSASLMGSDRFLLTIKGHAESFSLAVTSSFIYKSDSWPRSVVGRNNLLCDNVLPSWVISSKSIYRTLFEKVLCCVIVHALVFLRHDVLVYNFDPRKIHYRITECSLN